MAWRRGRYSLEFEWHFRAGPRRLALGGTMKIGLPRTLDLLAAPSGPHHCTREGRAVRVVGRARQL